MNKYLMLSAATVFASAASASVGCYNFTFGSQNGATNCDGGTLYTGLDGGADNGGVWAWQHHNCDGSDSYGQGLVGKNAALGKIADMSDNILAMNYGENSTYLNYVLPKKIANGKPFEQYIGFFGTSSFFNGSGALANVMKCQNGAAASHGTKSTIDGVKEIIAAHRNAKSRSE